MLIYNVGKGGAIRLQHQVLSGQQHVLLHPKVQNPACIACQAASQENNPFLASSCWLTACFGVSHLDLAQLGARKCSTGPQT